jgi:hypothetical protein
MARVKGDLPVRWIEVQDLATFLRARDHFPLLDLRAWLMARYGRINPKREKPRLRPLESRRIRCLHPQGKA